MIQPRIATHAEAVYIARSLNLHIESVWEIIRGRNYCSYTELETAVHTAFLCSHEKSAAGQLPDRLNVLGA